MPKPSLQKTLVALFNPQLGDKEIHTFPKNINLKVNVIAPLEFELAYSDVKVPDVSHYTVHNRIDDVYILNINQVNVIYDWRKRFGQKIVENV